MADNHFQLEKFQIELTHIQIEYKSYLDFLGNVEKLEYKVNDEHDTISINDYPKLNIILRDKKKNTIITI